MKYAENDKEFIAHIISILQSKSFIMDIAKDRKLFDGIGIVKIYEEDGIKTMPITDECFDFTKQEIIKLRCDIYPNYDETIKNLKNRYL